MAVGGAAIVPDQTRDVLVNVNALGQAVPSARFMGGREYEIIRQGQSLPATAADRAQVLKHGVMLLPSVDEGSGPFQGRKMHWTVDPETPGQRLVALSWYLALMTRTCLDLAGARGPVIVEGPFARNGDYLDMLAPVSPDGVQTAASATGTSAGAALLCLGTTVQPSTRSHPPPADPEEMRVVSARWKALTDPTVGGAEGV